MLNSVILIGRLTDDVELRYTPNGTAVAKFVLAVDRRVAKGAEKQADFIPIVVWNKQAENCANYIGKGRLVAIDGRLQIRSYDDSNGIRRKAADVIAETVKFLDRAPNAPTSSATAIAKSEETMAEALASLESESRFNEEDVPF